MITELSQHHFLTASISWGRARRYRLHFIYNLIALIKTNIQGSLLIHHNIIDYLSPAVLQQNDFTLREDYQAVDHGCCGDREII
jgi:hypothetical protein